MGCTSAKQTKAKSQSQSASSNASETKTSSTVSDALQQQVTGITKGEENDDRRGTTHDAELYLQVFRAIKLSKQQIYEDEFADEEDNAMP